MERIYLNDMNAAGMVEDVESGEVCNIKLH